MTRNGATKSRILRMIAQKDKTLSDISRELRLAPSTVSQHLQELKDMGAVREAENEHIKKWKYYKLNPDFNSEGLAAEESVSEKIRQSLPYKTFFYSIVIIALAVAAYLAVFGIGSNVQKSSIVQVSLTDPPVVPKGTQSLYINYSSISVLAQSNGTSEWIQSNASGHVNLMSLLNVSQVIAGVEVPHSLKISMARFNITSSAITINGTTSPVSVLGRRVIADVQSNGMVNASSELLIDFSPFVRSVHIGNSTIYVMIPRARAALSFAGRVRISRGWIRTGSIDRLNAGELRTIRSLDAGLPMHPVLNDSANDSISNMGLGGA